MSARVFVVVGLGLGDEGKGATVDHLVRSQGAALVVRYNGGPQAAHHVVLPDGTWHAFSQFGSGMLVPSTRTHLSRFMLVEPWNLLREAAVLQQKGVSHPLERLSVDPRCVVVTPWHKLMGQLREIARGARAHGSVGMGVGQAVRDAQQHPDRAIVMNDLFHPTQLALKASALFKEKLAAAQILVEQHASAAMVELLGHFQWNLDLFLDAAREVTRPLQRCMQDDEGVLDKALRAQSPVVMEGAQGVLLDPIVGFEPFVTRTRTTLHHAQTLLGNHGDIVRVGVMRTYAHRHGPGPLVTEDETLSGHLTELHNATNRWQGPFRVGHLDLVTARYALRAVGGVDQVVLTGLDRLSRMSAVKWCSAYGATVPLDGQPAFDGVHVADRGVIRGIHPPRTGAHPPCVAETLMACQPHDVTEFAGWKEDVAACRTREELPTHAQDWLDALESSNGLATPIHQVCVGPTWLHHLAPRVP